MGLSKTFHRVRRGLQSLLSLLVIAIAIAFGGPTFGSPAVKDAETNLIAQKHFYVAFVAPSLRSWRTFQGHVFVAFGEGDWTKLQGRAFSFGLKEGTSPIPPTGKRTETNMQKGLFEEESVLTETSLFQIDQHYAEIKDQAILYVELKLTQEEINSVYHRYLVKQNQAEFEEKPKYDYISFNCDYFIFKILEKELQEFRRPNGKTTYEVLTHWTQRKDPSNPNETLMSRARGELESAFLFENIPTDFLQLLRKSPLFGGEHYRPNRTQLQELQRTRLAKEISSRLQRLCAISPPLLKAIENSFLSPLTLDVDGGQSSQASSRAAAIRKFLRTDFPESSAGKSCFQTHSDLWADYQADLDLLGK